MTLTPRSEIPRHPRHHPQLLVILFAEHREIRPALREQLADHGGDTAEEMRTEAILQTRGGRPLGQDPGGEAVRVHGLDVGIPDQVDFRGSQPGDVGFPGARVGTEIFGRRELSGVDEDRDDNPGRAPLGQSDQRQVAVMERSHGRHQGDRGPSRAKAFEGAPQRRHRADDHRASRHRHSISGGKQAACSGLAVGVSTLSSPAHLRQADSVSRGLDRPRLHIDAAASRTQFMIKTDASLFNVAAAQFT